MKDSNQQYVSCLKFIPEVSNSILDNSKQAMDQMHRQRLETEILIMDHPNLFEVFEEGRYHYLVMQFYANGELYDELQNTGCFSEHMAADLIEYLSYF